MIRRMFTNCFVRDNFHDTKIFRLEKIKNQFVQEKFRTEISLMARKYPTKAPSQLLKLLFHGSGTIDPELICRSEEGLDIRQSEQASYGKGIYFSDCASYTRRFAYAVPKQ